MAIRRRPSWLQEVGEGIKSIDEGTYAIAPNGMHPTAAWFDLSTAPHGRVYKVPEGATLPPPSYKRCSLYGMREVYIFDWYAQRLRLRVTGVDGPEEADRVMETYVALYNCGIIPQDSLDAGKP